MTYIPVTEGKPEGLFVALINNAEIFGMPASSYFKKEDFFGGDTPVILYRSSNFFAGDEVGYHIPEEYDPVTHFFPIPKHEQFRQLDATINDCDSFLCFNCKKSLP